VSDQLIVARIAAHQPLHEVFNEDVIGNERTDELTIVFNRSDVVSVEQIKQLFQRCFEAPQAQVNISQASVSVCIFALVATVNSHISLSCERLCYSGFGRRLQSSGGQSRSRFLARKPRDSVAAWRLISIQIAENGRRKLICMIYETKFANLLHLDATQP